MLPFVEKKFRKQSCGEVLKQMFSWRVLLLLHICVPPFGCADLARSGIISKNESSKEGKNWDGEDEYILKPAESK